MGDYTKVSRQKQFSWVVRIDPIKSRHRKLGLNMTNCDTQTQGSILIEG